MGLRLNGSSSGYVELNAPAIANNTNLIIPSVSNTASVATSDTAFMFVGNSPSNRNKIINGKFDIWQRGTSVVVSSTIPYSADRWESYRDAYAAGLTISRQTGTGIAQYCARIQRDSGNTSTAGGNFYQPIESINSYPLAGSNVVLSFWARAGANLSGSVTASIRTGTGTDGNFRNGNLMTTAGSSVLSLTTNWQKFIITGTIAANATQVGVGFYIAFSGTAGAADYLEVTQMQLELGQTPTAFETEHIGDTLRKCQRYYEKTYNISTPPGSNTGLGSIFIGGCSDQYSNALNPIAFKVSKRTTPAMTFYTPSGTVGSWIYARSGVAETNTTMNWTTDWRGEGGGLAFCAVGAAYVTCVTRGHWVADAEL